jgi:microcystin-dependent protein
MALDFPANPTDGEIFDAYRWSASKGVWQAVEEQAPITITSPTVPLTGQNGDLWFNTSNGLIFAYYSDGSSSQWVEVLSSAVPNSNESMPIGTIVQTARINAPTGWLLCEGQAVSRTEYVRLFNAIGTLYGSGDGTTTFNLPNLANRVPVGKGSGTFATLGSTGGSETHELTQSEMPRHTHVQDSHNHTQNSHNHTQNSHNHSQNAHSHLSVINLGLVNVRSPGSNTYNSDGGADKSGGIASTTATNNATTATNNATTATNNATTAVNQFTGGSGTAQSASNGVAHNNLQPYIVMNYMIKV